MLASELVVEVARIEQEGRRIGAADERKRIREELEEWLIGDIDPLDAGLMNGRRIVAEIERICPKEPSDG